MLHRRWAVSATLVGSLIVGGVAALVTAAPASAATLPTGFSEQVVLRGLDQPMNIEFAPDGRVFVAEKAGRIKVFDSLADPTATVFADLRTNVLNVHDRGLLGLALHPEFPTEPWVYALYTHDAPPGQTAPYWNDSCSRVGGLGSGRCVATSRLSRLRADGDVATGPEQVLVEGWCQQAPSHSVGDLRFGRDGALYVTHGDGASSDVADYGQTPNNAAYRNPCGDPPGGTAMTPPTAEGGALRAQDIRTPADPTGLNGALLRLDPVTGEGAAGNPGIDSEDANARRIVAHGLRNPFRFDIRPGTDEVWMADVGWNTAEEINVVTDPTALTNFGWPCFEGPGRQAGYDGANLALCETLYAEGGQTGPFYHFTHAQKVVPGEACPSGGSAWSGVAFYPTDTGRYPAEYRGAAFLADYTRNCIWAMLPSAPGGAPDPANLRTFAVSPAHPVDLAIGPDGDLVYVDPAGTVRRIVYSGANTAPTAEVSATPTAGDAPLEVRFDASGSTDPDAGDADGLRYAWDFTDDGTVDATTAVASHVYAEEGSYTARLRVTDAAGADDTATVTIQVGNSAPTATISAPEPTATWRVGDTITFGGAATDREQGELPASALNWRLIQHHCFTLDSCHEHSLQDWDGVAGGSFTAPDHEYPSFLELVLTATDAGGLTHVTRTRLDPKTVELTFVTDPPGLQVSVGSAVQRTPFTRTVIQGSANSVSAVTPQTLGDDVFTFREWSDDGAQTHVITAPTEATTYTAAFDRAAAAPTVATAACTPGASYGDPLPAPTQTATRIPGRFNFLEGPVWLADQNRLLVSDMQPAAGAQNVQPTVIRSLSLPDTFAVFAAQGGSNGLALSPDGRRVIAATQDERSVSSFDVADATRGVVAADYQGRAFNSPNDVTVRSDGTVYFTDPNMQRGDRPDEMAGKTGVYRVTGGQVLLVDDTLSQPNGVVLSPDEKTLYVGANNRIYRYPVLADGSTGARTEFATIAVPDGATVDCAGNVYWASYNDGRIHVFAPDGRELGTIAAGRNTTNAAFGGPDGRTLFITSGTWGNFGVYRVDLNVPGVPY
ncbi:MAG TPA: SMP-30/gluconolactonase/LRE family protein [Pilimelia sp.]|nr:SMP-30/gluconolactonase/LRE family protein [Pilimelia sp.]